MPPHPTKADDRRVVELNSVGLGLVAIGRILDIHPSTVAHRLKVLKVPSADTRRGFMEGVYEDLSPEQRAWLAGRLGSGITAKDLVRTLLVREFITEKSK